MRRFCLKVSVLFLILVSSFYGEVKAQSIIPQDKNLTYNISMGKEYEQKGQYSEAKRYYLTAQKLSWNNYDALMGLARTSEKMKDHKLVFEAYETLMSNYKNNTQVMIAYSGFLERNRYYIKAIELNNKLYSATRDSKYKAKIAKLTSLQKGGTGSSQKYAKKTSIAKSYSSPADVYMQRRDWGNASRVLQKMVNQRPNDFALRKKLADVYMADHNFSAASLQYRHLAKYSPNNVSILNALANSYLAQNRQEEASPVIERILAFNPSNNLLKEKLANIYMAQHSFNKAAELFEQILSSQPNNKRVLKSAANAYMGAERFTESSGVFQRLVRLNPKDNGLRKKLGLSYYYAQDYKSANREFTYLIKIYPNHVEILKYLTDINSALENYDVAARYLTRYIGIKQNSLTEDQVRTLKIKVGNFYLAGQNYRQAENVFMELSKMYPDDFDTLNALSDICLAESRFAQAVDVIGRALKLKPDDKELSIKMAKALMGLNDYAQAQTILEGLVAQQPNNPELLGFLADAYLAQKDYESAITTINQLQAIKPNDPFVMKKLGKAYILGCKFEDARDIFTNLSNNYPYDPEVQESMADVYLALDEYQAAIDILNSEMNKNPQNINLVIKFSRALISLNKLEEAKEILANAYSMHPENNDIKQLLGDVYLYSNDFKTALDYYFSVSDYENTPSVLYGIAEAYRFSENYKKSKEYYYMLLSYPEYSLRAKIGNAYILIAENKLLKAKDEFEALYRANPRDEEVKLGMAITYISIEDFLKALKILDTLPMTDRIKYEKAVALYKMGMYNDAYPLVKENRLVKARDLKQALDMKLKIELDPIFQYHHQKGDVNNELSFRRYGFEVSDVVKSNIKAKAGFTVTPYYNDKAKTTAREYTVGLEGRPLNNLSFDTGIGFKDFSNSQQMLTAKALFKLYVNDALSLNGGFTKTNIEQTMLSSTGLRPVVGPLRNQTVGQESDYKFLMGYGLKLPQFFYNYGGFNLGFTNGVDSAVNFYREGIAGLGKVIYSRPKGRLLDLLSSEYTLYYAGYNENHSGFGGASLATSPLGSDGGFKYHSFGGYFSPDYIIANKFAMHMRGTVCPINTKYYLYGYLGQQTIGHEGSDFIWGASTSLKFNEDGRFGLGLMYQVDDYQASLKHDFIVNLIMRL
jgi:tetratricopeptide (TPR) repeat protein